MDERKLVDYGICRNSTLHTYVEDSVIPVILLYVKRSYAEGAITIYSRIYNTIKDVKSRIAAKEGIKSNEFSLIHDGKFLEDGKTVAFLNIDDEATLHMVLNPRDKFCIPVVMPTYEIVHIEVKATLFVRDVKTVIQSKVGQYSMDDMDLFSGKQKVENHKELHCYDIKEDSLLQVVPRTMQTFIRKLNGESIMLDVHKHDLIKDVKCMLLNKLGTPVHLQALVFARDCLADSRDLASYNIHKELILYLLLHMTRNVTAR